MAKVKNLLILMRLVETLTRWRENNTEMDIVVASIAQIIRAFKSWRRANSGVLVGERDDQIFQLLFEGGLPGVDSNPYS